MTKFIKQAEIIAEAKRVLLEKKIQKTIKPYIIHSKKAYDELIRKDTWGDWIKLEEILRLNEIRFRVESVNKANQLRKYVRGYKFVIYHKGRFLKSFEYDV